MTPATSMRRESPQPSSGDTPPFQKPTNNSDNDSGGEKPVREKLRETRIANQVAKDDMTTSPDKAAEPLRRKRSLEDTEDNEDRIEEPVKPGKHARKRSRSNTPGDKMDSVENSTTTVTNGSRDRRALTPELSSVRAEETHPVALASPKNKRTHDQVLEDDANAVSTTEEEGQSARRSADKDNQLLGDDRQTKRHRDSGSPEPAKSQGTTKIAPSSGFANTSTASPFDALVPSPVKAGALPTSEGKFASSGFGKLANASASSFAVAKGPSVFGAPAAKSAFASATKPMQPSAFGSSSSSVFGGSLPAVFGSGAGASIFGSKAKTVGTFGSSFASPGTSGFSGGSGPKIEGISDKPAKAFGAAEESDEEPVEDDEEDDGEGHKSPSHVTTDEAVAKKDKRFFEQEVETGEEGETTLFTSRAKLFSYGKNEDGCGAWKERGSGFIKVNVRDAVQGEEGAVEKDKAGEASEAPKPKRKARFILRANGTNRLVLNSPVDKHTSFGQPGGNGAKPSGKSIMFMGVLDGGALQTLQLLMAPDSAKTLWETVQQLRKDM